MLNFKFKTLQNSILFLNLKAQNLQKPKTHHLKFKIKN